jgi:uncharacterized protein (TIGR02266 family)
LKKNNNSILLADDSKTFLMYVGLLVKRLGYHIYVAKDGVEAIKLAKEKKPSMIVLDYLMPRIDGSSCLSIIRKDDEIGNTPVIILTSSGSESTREEFLKMGACGFLRKPINITELHGAIRKCMKGKNGRQNIRVSLLMKTLIECEDEKCELFASNLSAAGMFLRTTSPFATGKELDIVFNVDQEDPVELKGKVIYTNELSHEIEPEPGMGIKFNEVPEDVKQRINYFLMKQLTCDLTVEDGDIEEDQFIQT